MTRSARNDPPDDGGNKNAGSFCQVWKDSEKGVRGRYIMIIKRRKVAAAVTLIEAMVAMTILAVAVIGASGYRYYAMLDARKASMQRTAAAIALSLCENWRGRGLDHTIDYDPVTYLSPELDIRVWGSGPAVPADFPNKLGSYRIVVEGVHYWATLCWKDDAATPGLRALNVVIAWQQAGTASEITTYSADAKTFKLTTYVSN
jgi:hypothetical protein